VQGKYDDLPEMAFYMVGDITEVQEKADKMAKDIAARKVWESAVWPALPASICRPSAVAVSAWLGGQVKRLLTAAHPAHPG
jgi:hypothetical protein